MSVDDAKIIALKQRRAIFLGTGQPEKAKAVDVEIKRLRGELPPDPALQPRPIPREVPPPVETGDADLLDLETAEAPRPRRGRPPRQG